MGNLSSQRIKQAALILFAQRGYEGASLADIIEDVGIKKSSIYNHYKSKDDLFLSVYESCVHEEIQVTKDFFNKHLTNETLLPTLKAYIEFHSHRIKHIPSAHFLFRFIIFPPHHLHDALLEKSENYFEKLNLQFIEFLNTTETFKAFTEEQASHFVHLYLVILQGIRLDHLTGGGYLSQTRLDIAWMYFIKQVEDQFATK